LRFREIVSKLFILISVFSIMLYVLFSPFDYVYG